VIGLANQELPEKVVVGATQVGCIDILIVDIHHKAVGPVDPVGRTLAAN